MCCTDAEPAAGTSTRFPSAGQGSDQCQREAARHTMQASSLDTMTPAQAYAYAVKTGQDYNHTLHYTIERKQPLRHVPDQPPPLPLCSINTGAERGGLYAQRLYASATSNKSSSSLPSNKSPCKSTQPIDKPSPVTPSVPEIRPLSRSQHHHRSSSRSPSALDACVVNATTQRFNVADLYHSSLPRGDLRSLRTHRSGPGSLAAVGSRAEPAPLSAPPLPAPIPLAAYPRFPASISHTQLPQRAELSSPPISPEGFPSGRLRHNLSAHDIKLSAINRPSSCETSSLQASSAVPVPTVQIMIPPRSTSPLSNVAPTSRTDRVVGRTRNASSSFSLPLERSLLQGTTSTAEGHRPSRDGLPPPPPFEPVISSALPPVSLLEITSSPISPSSSSFERPSSVLPYQQGDLPCYTPPHHAISSSSAPFGDEKSRLPHRFITPSPVRPAVDRRVLSPVSSPFRSPRMTTPSHENIISTSPPSTFRSPSPRSPPRSTDNLSVAGNPPHTHSETSTAPLVLRTPEPTEYPAEQPLLESPSSDVSLPNPYDKEQDEDSPTSSSPPPGTSPIPPEPSENADDLMDAIESLMVASSL